MDILGHSKLRKAILEYYEKSSEPSQVKKAVESGINREKSNRGMLRMALFGAKSVSNKWS